MMDRQTDGRTDMQGRKKSRVAARQHATKNKPGLSWFQTCNFLEPRYSVSTAGPCIKTTKSKHCFAPNTYNVNKCQLDGSSNCENVTRQSK